MRHRRLLAVAAAFVLLSCSSDKANNPVAAPATPGTAGPSDTSNGPVATEPSTDTTSTTVVPRPPAQFNWTVLIYMDIDNNLEAQKMVTSLGTAAEVGSTADVNVIALVDRTGDNTADPTAPDGDLGSIPAFEDAKLIRVDQGDYAELQDLGEIDMGDPQTLAWFVHTGVVQYPSNHYSLIFANHGGAIQGAMWDDASGSNLSIPEMSDGIASGLRATGVPKIDLIGYDACLMATYDTAVSLAPVADWLVASEEVSLTNTYDYGAALRAIVGNPNATGEDMGRAFVDNSVDPQWPIGTTSLLDLSQMGRVQQAVDSLGRSLRDSMSSVVTELGRQRAQTLEFGIDPDTGQNLGFSVVDLGDLTRRLSSGFPDAVQVARSAVFDAVAGTAVDVKSGPAAAAATGMSIYFPQSPQFYDSGYDALASGGAWREMVKAYFDAGGTPGPNGTTTPGTGPSFESAQATLQVTAEGVIALARLTADSAGSVIDARIIGGILQPDGSVHHVIINPAVIGAGDVLTVGGAWDFVYLTLSDGATTLEATTVLDAVPGALRVTIPLLYQAPDGLQAQITLQFTLDEQGNIIDQPHFIIYGDDGSVAELNPAAGSLLAPLVLVSAPGGDPQLTLVGSTALDPASMTLSFARLAAGSTFHVLLLASDVNNIAAVATGVGTVP